MEGNLVLFRTSNIETEEWKAKLLETAPCALYHSSFSPCGSFLSVAGDDNVVWNRGFLCGIMWKLAPKLGKLWIFYVKNGTIFEKKKCTKTAKIIASKTENCHIFSKNRWNFGFFSSKLWFFEQNLENSKKFGKNSEKKKHFGIKKNGKKSYLPLAAVGMRQVAGFCEENFDFFFFFFFGFNTTSIFFARFFVILGRIFQNFRWNSIFSGDFDRKMLKILIFEQNLENSKFWKKKSIENWQKSGKTKNFFYRKIGQNHFKINFFYIKTGEFRLKSIDFWAAHENFNFYEKFEKKLPKTCKKSILARKIWINGKKILKNSEFAVILLKMAKNSNFPIKSPELIEFQRKFWKIRPRITKNQTKCSRLPNAYTCAYRAYR